jgi:hypothetical protein
MSAVGVCTTTGKSPVFEGHLRARCEVGGNGRDCRIMNLNSRRVFVESFVPAVKGSKVTLHFRLPNGHQVSADGIVSHHQFREGFNVDFTGLSAHDREQITSIVG